MVLLYGTAPNLDIFSHEQNDAIETNLLSIHLFFNAFDQLNCASVTKGKKVWIKKKIKKNSST